MGSWLTMSCFTREVARTCCKTDNRVQQHNAREKCKRWNAHIQCVYPWLRFWYFACELDIARYWVVSTKCIFFFLFPCPAQSSVGIFQFLFWCRLLSRGVDICLCDWIKSPLLLRNLRPLDTINRFLSDSQVIPRSHLFFSLQTCTQQRIND